MKSLSGVTDFFFIREQTFALRSGHKLHATTSLIFCLSPAHDAHQQSSLDSMPTQNVKRLASLRQIYHTGLQTLPARDI